jgi:type IX secretion system PorP/SprF family membrane protein
MKRLVVLTSKPTIMKHIVTIAFISTCLFSFGQSESYWNNYANFNPAMSGFQNKQHAGSTFYNYFPSLSGNYTGLYADAGMNLANNHGIGIAYTGDFNNYFGAHTALLNYNYQFHFEEAGKLSIGTGLGVGRYSLINPLLSTITKAEKENIFELSLGASYNWKNILVGFSATNLIQPEEPDSAYTYLNNPPKGYHFHAEHIAQIADKFQLTTRVLYSFRDGFQRLHPNLTLTYDERFSLGASYQLRDAFGVNAGWNIMNKFRVAYNFSATISKLSNGVSGGKHEVSIGYVIKN